MIQLRYINRMDLGFDHKGIIQLTGLQRLDREQQTAVMRELNAIPQIEIITASGFEPQHDQAMITDVEWEGKSVNDKPSFQEISADHRFAETFRLKMVRGTWWEVEGERKKIVLNEEAVRVMGLREPVGAVIRMFPEFVSSDGNNPKEEYEVAGVVKDFHTLSLRSRIYPAIFRGTMWWGNSLYIRTAPGEELHVMKRISAILPGIHASLADAGLTPLDELYNRLNRTEQAGLQLFTALSLVCLLISLFGIYAIATASARLRRKEIAIRKVSGAETHHIIRMFFREYAWQVAIAAAVALPVATLAVNRWLQGYAYHADIPWWLPAAVVFGVGAVVLLTALRQTLKAASSNPTIVSF
jgi:putative ABC transport system permease protein